MVVTSSCPDDTTNEYSSRRCVRSIAEKTEPECVTSAMGPAGIGSRSRKPIARTPVATLTKPMQPPPQISRPSAAAISSSRSPWALPKTTAPASPREAASRTCWISDEFETPSRTRSTGSGRSASEGRHGWPSTVARPGFTRKTSSKPGLRRASVAIRQPNESGRSLAPTTATVRASSIERRPGRTTSVTAGGPPAAAAATGAPPARAEGAVLAAADTRRTPARCGRPADDDGVVRLARGGHCRSPVICDSTVLTDCSVYGRATVPDKERVANDSGVVP